MVPFRHFDKGCKFDPKNMINMLAAAALATLHRRIYFFKTHPTITGGDECNDAMIQSGIFALLLQLSLWMFLCTRNNAARYCEMPLLFNYVLSISQSDATVIQLCAVNFTVSLGCLSACPESHQMQH